MKRPILHRLFSSLLALLILTTSVGLTVQQHTCRRSGHHTASVIFSVPRHGCPALQAAAHPAKARLQGPCCDFSAHFHKLDAASPDLDWAKLVAAPFLAVMPPPLGWQPTATAQHLAVAAWYASDAAPPPRSGRDLLVFLGTLVV